MMNEERENASHPLIDERDWADLTLGERIRQIEVEGFVVIPGLLSPEHIKLLKSETSRMETVGRDYSDKQRGKKNLEFEGGSITELIAHPPTIAFLHQLFGEEVIFMSYVYGRSEPGHPGISLHTDEQPYGSAIFGYEASCPFMVRVLYYLDDLTPEISPFRVVPRSHLSMHADANPYKRYESHPEEVMVPAQAGSAVFINHRVFHGNFPNVGDRSREMLAILYRPGWSGPMGEVERWDAEQVAALPDTVKPFFIDPNTKHEIYDQENKPSGMAREAPGLNPSRWTQR